MCRKHTVTANLDAVMDQLKDYAFAFRADSCDLFHFDNEFPATKVYARLLTRILYLGCPGHNELSFHDHPTPPGAIDKRDSQHCSLPNTD
jgi:hypothetical protein